VVVVAAEDFDILAVQSLVAMAAAGHIVPATVHRNVKAAKVAKEDIYMGFVHMPADFVLVHNSADSAEEHSLADFEIAPDEVGESKSKMAVMVVVAEVMSMDIPQLRALKEILLVEGE